MKYLAKLFVLIGFAIIIFVRVDGVDMTEGQLLLNYFPYLILAMCCMAGGMAIINHTENKE